MRRPIPDFAVLRADALGRLRETFEHTYDLDLYSFPQTWGSTALGFGGIGGQAITTAQTTVFVCQRTQAAVVYFAEAFAYSIPDPSDEFWRLLQAWDLPPVSRTAQLHR